VKDVDNLEEGIAPPTTHPDVKTLIVAPVIFEDHYYGNVTLRHTRAGYYQEPDRLLLLGMATQLAITLRRLEAVEAQQEAEQQARSMEVFTQLGQSAYEITHRLGNELGLVATCVNQIRDVLEEHKIASTVIDEELNKIVKDVGQVLSMCTGVKEKVAGLQDEGKSTPLPVILPVKALLEEAKWSSSPANIEMSWVVADDLGSVKIVAGQIIDILYTLITNAIEAMPEGGRITVRAYKSGSDVHVEVADNGPGISPANQSKIFNLFFSTKRSSGFGLWSAQRYARANGGDLTVSSELGKGATLTLKLPLASSPENGHS
jgi:signal transduction histidine kinase